MCPKYRYLCLKIKKMAGFIFDMDGTMVDNMMVHHRAWQIKLAELGLPMDLEEVRQTIHGKNEEILARLFGDRFSNEDVKRIAWEKENAYRRVFISELKLIDGLGDFLQKIQNKGIPMGVGTAAPQENVNFVLDNIYGLRNHFSTVVHAGMVTKGKPDPQVFELVARGLDVPLKDCLIFEDSPIGVETARRAGCQVVVVTSSHTREEFAHFPNVLRFIEDYQRVDDLLV